jgi:hypothetical protein
MHPGITDLSQFSDLQLEEKLYKLNRYYFLTDNTSLRQQMLLVMDTYKVELEERRTAAKIKQQQENGDNDLDSLINVS